MRDRLPPAGVVLGLCLCLWLSSHHGAIRSPDAEVQYRACEALALTGSGAVGRELSWRGFGLATGVDGGRYAVFGPLQPALCAPWYRVVQQLSDEGARPLWPGSDVRRSLYAEGRVLAQIRKRPSQHLEWHRLRAWVSLYNVLVSLLALWAFSWALAPLVSERLRWLGALLLGACTLVWPYSGTFFGEPTAMLCFHVALGAAFRCDRRGERWALISGFAVAMATCAHVSAILWAPFVFALVLTRADGLSRPTPLILRFGAGAALPAVALLGLNWSRFGVPIETRRTVDAAAKRSARGLAAPWRGPWGLVASASKGLLVYCPLVLLSLWAALKARRRALALILAAGVVARWMFLACRSDWHAGFGLGPRLMLLALPPLVVFIVWWLREARQTGGRGSRRRVVTVVAGAAAAQQAWLSLGEPYAWYQLAYRAFVSRGVNPFLEDRLYFDWAVAPALHLHHGPPGPWWLDSVSAGAVWLYPALVGLLVAACCWWLSQSQTPLDLRSSGV